MGKGSKPKAFFMDAKMKNLVQQFCSDPNNQPIMVENVVEYVSTFKEYSRHNRTALKLSVTRVLDQIRSAEAYNKNRDTKKYKDSSDEEIDSNIELVEAKDFNLLNASLRNSYQSDRETFNKQQRVAELEQQRLAQQEAEAAASDTPQTPKLQKRPLSHSPAPNNNNNNSNPQSENGSSHDHANQSESDGTTMPQQSPAIANGIAKKKRRLVKGGGSTMNSDSNNMNRSSSSKGFVEATELPTIGFESLGGIESNLPEIREHIEWPLLHPEVFVELRIPPSRGILLHGPPGCGKSLLANAIAGDIGRKLGGNLRYYRLSAPELVSGMSGESESNLRQLFEVAKASEPSLIFIDEIDVICPKRESASKEMERRIVAQLVSCIDDLHQQTDMPCRVMLIGATSRIDAIDTSVRRNGRFDREIGLGVPDEMGRAKILAVQAKKVKISGDFDFMSIARKTPGFVGADIAALVKEAAAISVKRIITQLETAVPTESSMKNTLLKFSSSTDNMMAIDSDDNHNNNNTNNNQNGISSNSDEVVAPITQEQLAQLYITMTDFEQAIKKVQPSAKREGFATIPNVTWENVGALQDIRDDLYNNIIAPVKNPWKFHKVGLETGAGVLMYGPPGCGKTLLAKAIANDCSASFISVKGPELLNKFVGESERGVRKVFERAKLSKPCIIFFDELDALCPRREDDNQVTSRVVNQLLTELDGLEERKGIFIIGATNRPDMIDPAMLRPQRFDKMLYVPLPNEAARLEILKTHTRNTTVAPEVDLAAWAKRCERFSGADLAALVKEAKLRALMRDTTSEEDEDKFSIVLSAEDFDLAIQKVHPSVSKDDERSYLALAAKRQQ